MNDNTKILIDEIHSKSPLRTYPTIKIIHIQIDEIWGIDLRDFSYYKTSNNNGFRYKFVIIDNSSKYLWAIPPKMKNSQAKTQVFSNILTTSKRSLFKLESDGGAKFYDNIFQKVLISKNKQHCSRFTYKGPAIGE